jgi:hypothetical protein
MTTYFNPLGYDLPGLFQTSSIGQPSTLQGTVGQVVQTTSTSAPFQVVNGMSGFGKGAVLQQAQYVRGGTTFPQIICPGGNSSSAYDSGTDIFGTQTFTPLSSTSQIDIYTSNFASLENAIVCFNLYINHGTPVTSSQVNSGAGGVFLNVNSPLLYTMPSPGVAFTVAVCSFGSNGSQNDSTAPNDYLKITERLPISSTTNQVSGATLTTSTYPQTQYVVGASTVVMASIPCPASASIGVSGQLSFFDTANLVSNSINFFFVAQRPSAGSVSISQSGFFYQAAVSSLTSMTITANTGSQTAVISAVGSAGSTWLTQLQYTVVNS